MQKHVVDVGNTLLTVFLVNDPIHELEIDQFPKGARHVFGRDGHDPLWTIGKSDVKCFVFDIQIPRDGRHSFLRHPENISALLLVEPFAFLVDLVRIKTFGNKRQSD